MIKNFAEFLLQDAEDTIANYIYHCNAQNPTGEAAFYYIMSMFGWAKRPMEDRLDNLDPSVPLTLIYGAKSWVDHYPAEKILTRRPVGAYVDYHVCKNKSKFIHSFRVSSSFNIDLCRQMLDAGHHVYAGQHEAFNDIILQACSRAIL